MLIVYIYNMIYLTCKSNIFFEENGCYFIKKKRFDFGIKIN